MGKLGDAIGTFDRLLSILERLGLWGAGGSALVSGAALGVWSAVVSLPPPVIAMCGLFGAAFGLWLWNGLNDLRRARLAVVEKPNYLAWDHVQSFTIGQAATLWSEREPKTTGALGQASYPYLRMLKEQAVLGNLGEDLKGKEIHVETIVLRADLVRLPAAKKTRPKFLFPGAR